MTKITMSRRVAATALLALAAAGTAHAAVPATGTPPLGPGPVVPQVTVMTRNLYLGANLLPIATAQPGAPAQAAVTATLHHVEASRPAARMRLVAHEIAAAQPDLVGLQEVSRWTVSTGSSSRTVAAYLPSLMGELRALHAPYRVVASHLSLHLHGPASPTETVHFSDGNAVLARSGVTVSDVRSADFRHLLKIPTPALGTVTATRSYNELNARVGIARFHFVNAHLEAYSAAVRLQQARELVAGPLHTRAQTILVGDLNSGAGLPAAADRAPFAAIRAAGYVDERTSAPNCCLSDNLRTGSWTHIVDHIMARPRVTLVRSFLTGRETLPNGEHPSDHGGVVSVLRLAYR